MELLRHKISEPVLQHCRELLIGCFRLARGHGFRTEKRFLQHPQTPKALDLFSLWTQVRPELKPLVENWKKAIKNSAAGEKQLYRPKKRCRKNHPRKNNINSIS